jgi:hypothetical protein
VSIVEGDLRLEAGAAGVSGACEKRDLLLECLACEGVGVITLLRAEFVIKKGKGW